MENQQSGILEFPEATPEEEAVAKRISEKVGSSYFSYNLPLQIFRGSSEDGEGSIMNYRPRKGDIVEESFSELFGGEPTEQDIKDLCNTTICILKNLIREYERFRDGKTDCVYYPNCAPQAR